MFDTLWDVTRDKTDIEKKKLYLFFLVRIFDWLYFRVQMMCGDFLNCFRSGGVYIFRKFWVDMLYPGNEFTKSGYLRCLRRFFFTKTYFGVWVAKIVQKTRSNWLTDIVHHLKCWYMMAVDLCMVKISFVPKIWSPEVKRSAKRGKIESLGTLKKARKYTT